MDTEASYRDMAANRAREQEALEWSEGLIAHAGLINLESQWGSSDVIYSREVENGGPIWEQGKVWKEQNPLRYAKNFCTPMLLSVGERNFRVPLNQTLENWSLLAAPESPQPPDRLGGTNPLDQQGRR